MMSKIDASNSMYVGDIGIDTGTMVDYGTTTNQTSSNGSYIALYVSITLCVIAGIVLGIIFGKRAANK